MHFFCVFCLFCFCFVLFVCWFCCCWFFFCLFYFVLLCLVTNHRKSVMKITLKQSESKYFNLLLYGRPGKDVPIGKKQLELKMNAFCYKSELRGYPTPDQVLASFVLLKIINTLFEKYYIYLIVNCSRSSKLY